MTTSCEIRFDENPNGVYFPGQTLAGTVELRLTEVTKVKGVSLQINGKADVAWSESEGSGISRITIYYHGRQIYLNSTVYLAGSKDGDAIDLLPGIHTYRFASVLPQDLVTSVEAVHGFVRYTVKVVLERPWKADQSYKVAFTVLRHVNLNDELYDVRLPAKEDKAKTFCCGPCRSNPMYISAEIPISGYVPGQTIAVKIEVNNQSEKKITEISTKLLRTVAFISKTPWAHVRTDETAVVEVRCNGVDPNSQASYEQYLLIPPMPPTSDTCEVLKVCYDVEVQGKIPGPVVNPKVRVRFTLGTIPLSMSAMPGFDDTISAVPVIQQPMPSSSIHTTHNIPYELPPPTYEEIVDANRTNIQDEGETNDIGCIDYTPRYMVYRFSEAPAIEAPLHMKTREKEINQ